MIRVLVSAKSAVTRAGLASLLRADGRFEVVGDHDRDADLARAIREHAPDVVLLEPVPPISTLPRHLQVQSVPAVVASIEVLSRPEIRRLLQAGVRGIIPPDASPQEIATALEAAAAGLAVVSPEVLDILVPSPADSAEEEFSVDETLTPRESEILALLAEGAGNKEIASRLRISEHTVKFHVSSILSKLGATTRTEAVARGYREGLILI